MADASIPISPTSKRQRTSVSVNFIEENERSKRNEFLKQLKETYKKHYDAVQPIPYIRDRLYCVERIFVEGGIEFLAASWVFLSSYHHVFREPLVKSNRRFLVGEPGYGKSTLTLQYAYDWCKKIQTSYLRDVEILILLRLRQLGGVVSIYNAIKRFLLSPKCVLTEKDIENILLPSSSVVVILDGFDEYPDEDTTPKTDIMKIINLEMFEQFEVVLTTRYLPKQYAPETKQLRLTGFDDRARDEYIRKAVVGDDEAAVNRIKHRLQDNPVLGDLCQVPLFFVMFAHMSHENKKFQNFNTVTSFFKYMIKCFHGHFTNKMENPNVQKYQIWESDHGGLDRIAFEGFSKEKQQIVWERQELINNLGKHFYDLYIRIGILVEDEGYLSNTGFAQDQREVRFYHKVFGEWYAAHYLAELAKRKPGELTEKLKFMDPLDLQYCYRFSCGIDPESAGNIIAHVKSKNGGEKFAILCVVEQGGRVENILHTVADLCQNKVEFQSGDNKLLKRSTVQLLNIASSHNIPISNIWLNDCFKVPGLCDGNYLKLDSDFSIPVLTTLKELTVYDPGGALEADEFAGILQYMTKCSALNKLVFYYCLLPQSAHPDVVPTLKSKNAKVFWWPVDTWYLLNLESCVWELTRGGVTANVDYQNVESNFRSKFTQQKRR